MGEFAFILVSVLSLRVCSHGPFWHSLLKPYMPKTYFKCIFSYNSQFYKKDGHSDVIFFCTWKTSLVFTVAGAGASLPSNGWRPEKLVSILHGGRCPLPPPTRNKRLLQSKLPTVLRLGNPDIKCSVIWAESDGQRLDNMGPWLPVCGSLLNSRTVSGAQV